MWDTLLEEVNKDAKVKKDFDKWTKFDNLPEVVVDDVDEEDIDAFFKKVYGNADSESKRAMMKSFV